MNGLYQTGVRQLVDEYLLEKSKEKRNYGNYWSASSAGYCQRKLIFERMGVPPTGDDDARKIRVFEVGHIFHQFMQGITREAGISIAQELELQDEDMMVRGHFDDLILVDDKLILYDYKTQNSRAFTWQKGKPMSHYHHMQLGTYMLMLRKNPQLDDRGYEWPLRMPEDIVERISNLEEARIMKISKDDLRCTEQQLMWSESLEVEVKTFWGSLNRHWREKTIPECTCAKYEGGFMAKPAFNPYYYSDEPCSLAWMNKCKEEGLLKEEK